jgi:predicted lysophospholipase L1 biosynthesis ABC-type transport system permease subunit
MKTEVNHGQDGRHLRRTGYEHVMGVKQRGTRAERCVVVAVILCAAALPLVANASSLHDFVWAFWLGSVVLFIIALGLCLGVLRRSTPKRERRAPRSG